MQMDATRMSCGFCDPGDEVGIVIAAFCAGAAGDYKSVDGTTDLGDGYCVSEHNTAIGPKTAFKAGIGKSNFVTRHIGKTL